MKFPALFLLALAASNVYAGSDQDEQLRPILIKAVTNQSKVLQLLIKCEAPADLTKQMSEMTMADLNEFKTKDAAGAAAFEAAFQAGKERADDIYQQLGKEANSSATCQQAIQFARMGMGS